MLYSVIIAPTDSNEKLNNGWYKETNEKFHFSYLENKTLRQRIRFGKGVKKAAIKYNDQMNEMTATVNFTPANKDTDTVYFSNSHTNMSLTAVTKPKDETDVDVFTDIAYITLENVRYKLLRYTLVDRDHTDIIQTYRKKDGYQGCAIGFNKATFKGGTILTLDLLDTETKKYIRYDIGFKEAEDTKATILVATVAQINKKEIGGLKKIEEKYKNRFLSFKITLHANPYPTYIYITTDDKYTDELKDRLDKNAPEDYRVILIKDEAMLKYLETTDFTKENVTLDATDQKVHDMFVENLVNERIRAVTLLDIDVPYKFCKQYNILYLFKNTAEKGYTFCLRSN